ncbi:MAG: hypothetical protein EOO39_09390 [Cytophagaceae bacterium]|nr:MAG: hypothetical protein EOO39_09390 [Cytophagaceae bacterium]
MLPDQPRLIGSFSLPGCTDHLQSLCNLYQAILRHIDEDPRRRETLEDLFQMNASKVRLRLQKPHMWRLIELQQIAAHYKLSTAIIANAQSSLATLSIWLEALPAQDRNLVLRKCHLHHAVFQNRQRIGWGIEHIWELRQGLEESITLMARAKKPIS